MASRRWAGRRGGTTRPPGRISPMSSNTITPLHSRLHPCSGWLATVWAASRSGRSAGGHGGRCQHIAHLWSGLRMYLVLRTRSSWLVLQRRYEPAPAAGVTRRCPCRWNLSQPAGGHGSAAGIGCSTCEGIIRPGVAGRCPQARRVSWRGSRQGPARPPRRRGAWPNRGRHPRPPARPDPLPRHPQPIPRAARPCLRPARRHRRARGRPAKIPPAWAPSGDAPRRHRLLPSSRTARERSGPFLLPGPDMATGRGDDSETHPYAQAKGPARAPRA